VSSKLILIIEDNENNRILVRDVLQATGFETVEAVTAEEGLRLACELVPDLILLDIQLPGMNGLAALRELRAHPTTQAIPVIAVTASARTQDRLQIMAAGFDGYQAKPIAIKSFIAAVTDALQR
jgi:two-component system cell cycle response regulator DivK